MIGPRMALLMVTPALLGLAAAVVLRHSSSASLRGFRIRGMPLVLVGFALAVLKRPLLPLDVHHDRWVGRGFAAADIAIAVAFLWVNRPRRAGRLAGSLALVTGAGVLCNALPVLVVGAMPFSVPAAHRAAIPSAEIAAGFAGYVDARTVSPVLAVFGDLVPVAPLMKVLSIGDMLMFAGIALTVACYFARALVPLPAGPLDSRRTRTDQPMLPGGGKA